MTLRSLDVCVVGVLAIGIAACSPSPGPEARGASRVFPYSSGCGPGPYIIPTDGTPTSERVAGDRITDGDNGDVDCSVTSGGGGYRIEGSLEQGPNSFSISGSVVEIPGTGVFQSQSPTGYVGFYNPNSGNISSQTCTLEVLESQEIGTGKVWGNFDCTQSQKEANPGFACNFEGSFIFENCN
jgi:hypothetical protein